MVLPLLLALITPTLAGVGDEDLDVTWPDLATQASPTGEGRNDAVLLVAIEDYEHVSGVPGARANADAWLRWFTQGRGVPASRVFKAIDGEAKDFKIREQAQKAAAAVQPGGTLWFVYIGHGAPSKDGRDGLLVGAEADRSADGIYRRSVSRDELLRLLDAGRQARTVALLDACFSGQGTDGTELVGGLQDLVPTVLEARVPSRTLMLTATGSGEFAGALPGRAQPAFSYLALGGLMGWADVDGVGNRDGRVSATELREYVAGALNLTVTGRSQTPKLLGSDADLSRATATKAPDLLALREALQPAPPPKPPGFGPSGLNPEEQLRQQQCTLDAVAKFGAQREAELLREQARVLAEGRAAWKALATQAEACTRLIDPVARQPCIAAIAGWRDAAEAATVVLPAASANVPTACGPKPAAEAARTAEVDLRHEMREASVFEVRLAPPGRDRSFAYVDGPLDYEMSWVAPGTFMMGTDRFTDQLAHTVTLTTPYLIGHTEVTQGLWTKVMGSNPSWFKECGADCPVAGVSWCDAIAFANKLSTLEALTPVYTVPAGFTVGMEPERCAAAAAGVRMDRAASGYRLPTEAEWEYAARVGAPDVSFIIAVDGDGDPETALTLDDFAWYAVNSGKTVHSVGQRTANDLGLHDTLGNVWEWTWDVYGDYPGAVNDPVGPATGQERVVRGGSWFDTDLDELRTDRRGWYAPGERPGHVGLRLARTYVPVEGLRFDDARVVDEDDPMGLR